MAKKIGLTKIEKEKQLKKEEREETEYLEAAGQESEAKAKKWVEKSVEAEERKQEQEKGKELELLNYLRTQKLFAQDRKYRNALVKILTSFSQEIDWTADYYWGVYSDGIGIIAWVKNGRDFFRRAFRISYEPKYDLRACELYAVWLEDLFDKSEGSLEGEIWKT